MEPVFTVQYGEFAVADYLSKNIKDTSVFIPTSAQQKGIDLLLYQYSKGRNTTCTIQVKMSRTYYNSKKSNSGFPYHLWFNRFPIQDNADWYILVGIYAKHPKNHNAKAKSTSWDTIMLAFTHDEMMQFMDNVRQKKDPSKIDKMFGFGFDDSKTIFQTRGCATQQDMTNYLIEKRLGDIQKSYK